MYVGIDIGGTKTFVAILNDEGVIQNEIKFPTPNSYPHFLSELAKTWAQFGQQTFTAIGVGVPGLIDHRRGIALACGNLPWVNIPIKHDVQNITKCPTVIENDAKLAGLSEAMLLKDRFDKVLYLTISTGIGSGVIDHQKIDHSFIDIEAGQMMFERGGKYQKWEDFASGKAIVERFGKQAHEIHDQHTWRLIAADLAIGIIELIAIVQPEIIVLGGSVGRYYGRFSKFLHAQLKRYQNPLMPIPPIQEAKRPDQAVVFGCYDLAKAKYGSIYSPAI